MRHAISSLRDGALWGNRLGKTVIMAAVVAAVGGTGWLAGHGAASPRLPPDPLPQADLNPHVITVGQTSLVSRLTVNATIQSDAPVDVRPVSAGTVSAVYRKAGQQVSKGDVLAAYKTTGDPTAGGGTATPGAKTTPAAPKPVTKLIHASVTGTVAAMSVGVGQSVSPDATVAQIDQGKFRAVASIDSKDVYRLYTRPKEIKLAIDHGPAPFPCALIAYGAGAGTAAAPDTGTQSGSTGSTGSSGSGSSGAPRSGGATDGSGSAAGSGTVQVACRVPGGQKVFGGVTGQMAITTDSATDATVVPLSAVLGQAQTGRVTLVGADGRRTVRTVRLGITDGTQIQVVSGLQPGDKILDRAPEDPAFSGPKPGDLGGGKGGGPGIGPVPADGGVPAAPTYVGGGG